MNIPGVDENIFNDLFDGDVGLFMSVLHTFVDKTPDALNKLRSVSKETLPDYAIRVHGMKGACANICAEKGRKAALELEMMARAGDLPGVLTHNGAFLEYMDSLLADLKNWIKNQQQ